MTVPTKPLRHVPRLILRLAGARSVAFLALGSGFGLAQSYVDILLSAYLTLFISSIGLMQVSGTPGMSFLPHGSTLQISLGLLVVGILRSVFQYLVNASAVFGFEAITARLRLLVVKQLLDAGRRRSPSPTADTMLRVSEIYPRAAQVLGAVLQMAASLVQVAGLFVFSIFLARREALTGVAGLGLLGLVLMAIGRRIRRHTAALPEEYAKFASGLERVTRNQLLVRVLRTEGVESPKLKALILGYYRRSVAALNLGGILGSLPTASGVVLVVGIIYLSQAVWKTPGPVLLSFIYLFIRLVQALGLAASQASIVTTYAVFLGRALRDVAEENDDALPKALSFDPTETGLPKTTRASRGTVAGDAVPRIEVSNASFRYEGSEAWALKNFSLSIAPGEHVGITGPSGCGKSTLVQLVLGVLDPVEGSVVVGGRDTREVQPVEHVRIGYVGAEPFLFEGSVEENLRYGSPPALGEPELWEALESAQISPFVRALPAGLATPLGEGGEGLSAGQKQRLSLARALLTKPQILVLDEATANLDNATEADVAAGLSGLLDKVTVLIIAHRPGILAHCTRVIPMVAPQ